MKCEEIKDLFSPYLENDLDTDKKRSVDEHLGSCQSCGRELGELKEMLSCLREIPEVEPPPYFLEAVRMRLERPSLLTRVLRWVFFPLHIKVPIEALTVTATVVLIVLLVQKTGLDRFSSLEKTDVDFPVESIDRQAVITEADFRAPSQRATQEQFHPQSQFMPKHKGLEKEIIKGAKVKNEVILGDYSSKTFSAIGSGYDLELLSKKAAPLDLIFPSKKTQVILKTKNLDQDISKLQIILKNSGIEEISQENYPDKVLFGFQIFTFQLETLLSKLKDWQEISLSPQEITTEEDKLRPLFIELILTAQEGP